MYTLGYRNYRIGNRFNQRGRLPKRTRVRPVNMKV